jgi:hypothetical protein
MDTSTKELSALSKAVENLTGRQPVVQMLSASVVRIAVLPGELSVIYYFAGASKSKVTFPEEKLIHLDHDVWLRSAPLVCSRLKVRVGLGERMYARKGVVARVDKMRAINFQREHHLQQAVAGKYRYGLFIDGELTALMVFSGGRLMQHTEGYRSFECLRFCTKQGTVVIGAFSRLMAFFILEFKPDDIMTYVDKDWSDGSKFTQLGFVAAGETGPQRFWVHRTDFERISEKDYTKLSEADKRAYYSVQNSGSLKMVRVLNPTN